MNFRSKLSTIRLHRWTCVIGIVIWWVIAAGCQRSGPRLTAAKLDDPASALEESREHLILALDFLDSFHKYDAREMIPRIINHLQTWVADAEPAEDWIADPLFGRLPQRLKLSNNPTILSRLRFQRADVSMLREAMWLSEIAEQTCRREPRDTELMSWLSEREADYGIDGCRDLACANQLFDWVVRNIQLETSSQTDNGIPVSNRFSWEALLLGRGDAQVRSQLFIRLCRQARIPALMLGRESERADPEPWVVGTWISDRLFLFDPTLGLPIPSQGDRGIAHLVEILDDPELLRQLDLDGAAYRVGPSSLNRLVAMMEASPRYLSQRMHLVEDALPSNYRMVLSSAPSALARELRAVMPNLTFQLWTLPYDTMQSRSSLRDNPEALRAIEQELSLFLEDTPLASARREHFRGRLADDPPAKGAKSLYMQCRMPNAQIETLDAQQLRGLYGIPRDLNLAPEILARMVSLAKQRVRLAKEYASYWLGLIAFEEGRPAVAIDFLRKRTLEAYPHGIWKDGARYNLARSLEMRCEASRDEADREEAISLYQTDKSPQSHGNNVRARRLQ